VLAHTSAGHNGGMDIEQARALLRENHRAVMGTVRADGGMQLSPVLTALDEQGRAVVSTRETAVKAKNLRRNPHAVLCVLPDGFFGEWVQVEGRADVVALPEALPVLEDYYRTVSGEHPDWEDYRAAMRRERRVVVRIPLERVGPSVSG
jgi:PPOX class probable F420-dependent enzyme